ncbi:hypothetical protein VTI28DRAFT_1066 [Corynascus sepedonium]
MMPSRPKEVDAASHSSLSSLTTRRTLPAPSMMSMASAPAATMLSSRMEDRYSANWKNVTPASTQTEPLSAPGAKSKSEMPLSSSVRTMTVQASLHCVSYHMWPLPAARTRTETRDTLWQEGKPGPSNVLYSNPAAGVTAEAARRRRPVDERLGRESILGSSITS